MKLAFSLYEVSPTCKGALIRCEGGYSVLHPLEAWGDKPLAWHLEYPSLSPLMKRALHFAHLDSRGRREGIPLLKGKTLPKSHRLVTDLSNFQGAKGFTRVKVKVGKKPSKEIARLHEWIPLLEEEGLLLRLDFNLQLTHEQFHAYMGEIKLLHPLIEFIEDPFVYEEESWEEEMAFWRCTFALDQDSERGIGKPRSAPILVVKPLRQDEEPFYKAKGQKIIVTSLLDHPLGQTQAAYIASKFPPEIGGLLSHKVFMSNPFSHMIEGEGSSFKPPPGTGFGFDALLEKEEWTYV